MDTGKKRETKKNINQRRRKNETGQKCIDDQHSDISEIGIEHTSVKRITITVTSVSCGDPA